MQDLKITIIQTDLVWKNRKKNEAMHGNHFSLQGR